LEAAVSTELEAALTQVCDAIGADVRAAQFIKYTMNAVYRVGPYVLRLSRDKSFGYVESRVGVARALAAAGAPVIRLAELRIDQPIRAGGWLATVWEHVPSIERAPSAGDLAEPLRRFHALAPAPGVLPGWDPLSKVRKRLAQVSHLPPVELDQFARWTADEFSMAPEVLVGWLSGLVDECEADLRSLTWELPTGTLHGDAHTGNIILGSPGTPLLCDLDGICAGPPEWDLVPTAHGVARFGRSRDEYRDFVTRYGFDVTLWSGWRALRKVREVQVTTSVLGALAGRPKVAEELAFRLRSLIKGDESAVWRRFQ
jgi:hypothetical protein